ncbi:DUF6233 domain-containing protein [Actinacidiphila glaucinigra]|uniref:DUF6233 domain-containing protein n=1 Tax=Actinacidiphila glaucinigra TaxID=235986 RepID=UPI0036BF0F95
MAARGPGIRRFRDGARAILHRTDCWIDSGEDLTPVEASHEAARPNVELCPLCRPSPPVRLLHTEASAAAAA